MSLSDERLTVTIPEAAKLLSLGRSSAYQAAKSGELPTLRIGKKLLVPIAALQRMLDVTRREQNQFNELENK